MWQCWTEAERECTPVSYWCPFWTTLMLSCWSLQRISISVFGLDFDNFDWPSVGLKDTLPCSYLQAAKCLWKSVNLTMRRGCYLSVVLVSSEQSLGLKASWFFSMICICAASFIQCSTILQKTFLWQSSVIPFFSLPVRAPSWLFWKWSCFHWSDVLLSPCHEPHYGLGYRVPWRFCCVYFTDISHVVLLESQCYAVSIHVTFIII